MLVGIVAAAGIRILLRLEWQDSMRRREFIITLGGAAATAAWPPAGRAQQSMPVIGLLNSASPGGPYVSLVQAFRDGLKEIGYVEGQNVAIEYRWAQGQYDRLAGLAAELISRPVQVIVATGGEPSALAAKAATSTIPIVFAIGGDPVRFGLVTSFTRPLGNITGYTLFTNVLGAGRLRIFLELVPNASVLAMLVNPNNPNSETNISELQAAARDKGREIIVLKASAAAEFETAFTTLAQQPGAALFVNADPFFNSQQPQLVALAARYSIPAFYELSGFAVAGGLASYGPSITDAYHQVGLYTGQILKGAKPAELPVMQPTKFELVINLKTAKALGLEVPAKLLAYAKVIE
jgi:putative ABC transport system substrate-binding protein